MSTRNVTGTLLNPSGNPRGNALIRVRLTRMKPSNGAILPRVDQTYRSDPDGSFSIPLWTGGEYRIDLPSNEPIEFTLPEGAGDIELSELT